MSRLKVLASGKSTQAQAQSRGKLFEELVTSVLRDYGYQIDRIPNVNYAGMEIDIEGTHRISRNALYAECKCYETEVESSKLQAFLGKYMTLWFTDEHCHGLFVAIPGVNSHAKAFYKQNCETNPRITLRLIEEDAVLEALYNAGGIVRPETIGRSLDRSHGSPGEQTLLYTDKGVFWIQYVIPVGSGIPSRIAFFTGDGAPVYERATIDYLISLYSELADFEAIVPNVDIPPEPSVSDEEEIVEVRGSSACFEYQFPASPQFFVGRTAVLADLDGFVEEVLTKQTSRRGLLFEANSGWGKSSAVLAAVDRLRTNGHFAISLDSRSASSSRFILRAVEYTLRRFHSLPGPLYDQVQIRPLSGFEGAIERLLSLKTALEQERRIVFIFLDQFENVFFQPDVLRRIRDLFLKICDAQTNIVFGFSWKTDLVGHTNEFPYQLRDALSGFSKKIALETFSESETNTLLDKLSEELHSRLRKDLRFFLSEFAQGYPWLLKKLCAHVKWQRESGVPQLQIANSLLNVEELFQEDLRGLTAEQEEVLRSISKRAPISILELGEEFRADIVQSLVHARLLVRIGSKYDIYWDIFRDYLNTGKIPVQENYILRVQTGGLRRALTLLTNSGGRLDVSSFQSQAGLSEKSFQNVIKDLRLLGLARVQDATVILLVNLDQDTFEESLRDYLRDRLPRNRLVSRLLETLELFEVATIDDVANLLSDWCPYISASHETWKTYARIFAGWMDIADLAVLDYKSAELSRYKPGREIRERRVAASKRRGGMVHPIIQYSPIEKALLRIYRALQTENRIIDWTGFKKSTIAKTLATLEDLGFINRKGSSIAVQPRGMEFMRDEEKRPSLFAKSALTMQSFKTFVEILNENTEQRLSYDELGTLLRERLATGWTDGTAKVNAKIMLDWARHARLAPEIFASRRRINAP